MKPLSVRIISFLFYITLFCFILNIANSLYWNGGTFDMSDFPIFLFGLLIVNGFSYMIVVLAKNPQLYTR